MNYIGIDLGGTKQLEPSSIAMEISCFKTEASRKQKWN